MAKPQTKPTQPDESIRELLARSRALPEVTLYQWPASKHCDSIYVRCTKIHRVLGLLGATYNVADVSFPKTVNESEISDKVNPLMQKIPIIKVDDNTYVEGTAKIVEWLLTRSPYPGFSYKNQLEKSRSWFIEHWAERWLVWLIIYGRWLKEDNFLPFVNSFCKAKIINDIPRSIQYVRTRACRILKTTEVGSLKTPEYMQELQAGINMLNTLLESSEFVSGNLFRECDLSVFMSIQALLDPSLAEESALLVNHKALMEWFRKVDTLTQTKHTRPLSLVKL